MGDSEKKVGSRDLVETSESDFSDFRIGYLDEYEAICEKALARESGPYRRGCLMKKKPRVENLVTLPL
jgi:hypothetical protein